MQRARRDAQIIDGVGEKFSADAQLRAVALGGEIIDGRRDAENIAQLRALRRAGLGGESHRQRALRRLACAVVFGGGAVGLAAHHAVQRLFIQPAPAIDAGEGEGHGAAQAQLERGIIETRLVGEAQPRDQHAAVGH